MFYFYQGQLRATRDRTTDPANSEWFSPYINTEFTNSGRCATFGRVGYLIGGTSSTNKCASYEMFGLRSYEKNAQLGAELVFRWAGGFWSCGDEEEIWYRKVEGEGPTNCYPVKLWTVPVPVINL
ncbi:hypothetical protein FA15DRAFT_646159 [Coprinopsis marcescibilis]|uniref:Uncharacterized protein n=1 Tax=Coprinopsis marcescibilis TaxID=230819 RepID=A0A5C3KL97_COPMA|nr:hypothetical protein FA15DRAFT_646159 [Coprinopsis marcescibilis]